MKIKTKKLTMLAMLAAISVVLLLIRVPFPPALFLEYDPADIPVLIGTFAFGPLAGFVITLIVSVIQGLTFSSSSGVIGIIMHIFSTGSFAVTAGIIYRGNKTRKTAIIALAFGALAMTVSMVIFNLIFTPIFMGAPLESVIKMLVPIIIPFNLLKASINGALTFILYKSVSKHLFKKIN